MEHAAVAVTVTTIPAGKLRRYHGESAWQRLTDIRTIGLNLRDSVKIVGGLFKSLWIIMRFRPDVVFAKGGFVCLPLGLAAFVMRVPIVIHDSDTRPGLTNSILGKFAARIATGSPLDNYRYDTKKAAYTGVPIDAAFRPLSEPQQREAKAAIGVIDLAAPLVVVTGGGLGAKSINDAMVRAADTLLEQGIHVYHITGKKHFDTIKRQLPNHPHYHVVPFVYRDMASVLGAADLVVARASATFLQELAGLAKPVVVVPAAQLSDQVKNAVVYKTAKAASVLSDKEITATDTLGTTIIDLIDTPSARHDMARRLHAFAKPSAAADVARMIIDAYNQAGRR
mgnify:CR=1 FL=1